MPVQRLLDVLLGRIGLAIEQRLGRHHHAVAAEAALAGLLLDERLLQRMELLERAQALDGGDAALRRGGNRSHTGAHGLALQEHRAGPALREAAAELRAVQLEVVSQYVEQRSVGLD